MYMYMYSNVPLIRDKENMIKGIIRVFRANTFNTSSSPKLVVALRVSSFFLSILHKHSSKSMKLEIGSIMCRF